MMDEDACIMIIISIIITSVIVSILYMQENERNETEQIIILDILDVDFTDGGWSSHGRTIITTNESIIILDKVVSLPIGDDIKLKIKKSKYKGEYELLKIIKG